MKTAIVVGAAILVGLFLVTTFVPSPQSRALAEAYGFTPEEIDNGLRYAHQRKLIFWTGTFIWLGFLTWLACGGGGRRLADACARLGRGRWLATVLLVGAVLFLARAALGLALGLVGLEVQHLWEMSHQGVSSWLRDYAVGLAVGAVTRGVVLVLFYLVVRLLPRWWWLVAALGGGALGMLYALLLPVLIEPLFHDFRPLADARLRQRIVALAERAGVSVDEVLVSDASRRGSHTNAYFTGFGPTRRIVLFDTLLRNHPPEEVESILGHEIGHWRHDHILKGITLATLGALAGFFVLSRVLLWAVGRRPFLLHSPADPAGLPLVLLLVALGTWLAMPVENAVSRSFERQADASALELSGRPEVFAATERRMARDNLSNVAAPPWSVWLFSTHPTAVERLQMAEEWKGKRP
jgi:STE24 endopeptidase